MASQGKEMVTIISDAETGLVLAECRNYEEFEVAFRSIKQKALIQIFEDMDVNNQEA